MVAYGPGCNDTLRTQIVISDDAVPEVDFSTVGLTLCAGRTYSFTSSVTDPTLPAQNFVWRFSLGSGSEVTYAYGTPVWQTLAQPGTVLVQHSIITPGGCIGTVSRSLVVEGGNVQVSNDTTVVKDARLFISASGGASYQWMSLPPATLAAGADSTAPTQQVYTGTADTGLRFVCISTGINGCLDYDTVRVTVTERAYTFVPNAFSPNGDGAERRAAAPDVGG